MVEAAPAVQSVDRLPLAMTVAWGSGAFGQAIAIYAFGVLLFRYLTDTAAISAALVGGLIALSKIYDAVIDPPIGFMSDRIDTPMGRRRPWILLGGVMLAGSLVALFNVPAGAGLPLKIGWVGAGLVLFSTGYSFFAIPWMAMPAEMTASYHERTRMMAWRISFASTGQATATLCGPVLLSVLGLGALGYGRMGLLLGGLCLFASVLTVVYTRGAPSVLQETGGPRPRALEQFRSAMRNRPFVILAITMVVLYFGGALQSGSMALFTRRVLLISDRWLGVYYLMITGAMLVAQPVWLAVSRRIGKKAALSLALVGQAVLQSSLFFFQPGQPIALLLAQAVAIGFSGGGVFMLTQSLLPDVIEHDFRRTGLRRAGMYSGAISFVDTGALALGVFALGLLLSGMGYVEGLATAGGQPQSALLAIRLAASFIPATTALICLGVMSRYPLSKPD